MKSLLLSIVMLLVCLTNVFSQTCDSFNFQFQSDIASVCSEMTMTMQHDINGLSYLYVANKEAGLKIYDINNIVAPTLLSVVGTDNFDTFDVMNLTQSGNFLFLAIGNHFTNPTAGGMAIVDISNPASPTVTDYYVVPNSGSGAGIVKVEGNYAYLGAMRSGLVILDVADKYNIQFVSQFIPDINFPPVTNPNADLYNARGMVVKNSIVYLCYDAGGIRIINCTNKTVPVETGHWCNPIMYTPLNHPKAYNNCVLDDSLLYVAVDYAGIEVLNVSDTGNISMTGWWNPNGAPDANWFACRIHTNEIHLSKTCNKLFVSDGKSDMHVVDVTNPAMPDSCNIYGGMANNIGTWGLSVWKNEIFLSYICAVIPFASNWTGVKVLKYDTCSTTGISEDIRADDIRVFPNPSGGTFSISLINEHDNEIEIKVVNNLGQVVSQKLWNTVAGNNSYYFNESLAAGYYKVQLTCKSFSVTKTIVTLN